MNNPLTLDQAAIYLADRGFLAGTRADRRHPPTLRTLQMWCKSGKLAAVKVGRDWLVTEEALDALIASASASPSPSPRPRWRVVRRRRG